MIVNPEAVVREVGSVDGSVVAALPCRQAARINNKTLIVIGKACLMPRMVMEIGHETKIRGAELDRSNLFR
jgi:hypothetical protein